MKELIYYLASSLTEHPEEVSVEETITSEGVHSLTLTVNEEDLSIVIGKRGRTAKAMRSLLAAASAKKNQRYVLEII